MKTYRLLLLLSSWAHKLTALNVAILFTCLIAVALVGYAVYLCRKEEKGLKLAACLMLWIGAVSLCAFQTHTFPALDTNNLWTGTNAFSSINKVIEVDQQAGATADVKMAACFALLPNGGTCDARGFGATTQSIAATVTVPTNITLQFDPVTKFQAASSALNLFIYEPESRIIGFTFDCTNQASYSGALFQNDIAQGYGGGTSAEPVVNKTLLQDITSNESCRSVSTGTALKTNVTGGLTSIFFVTYSHWRIRGLGNGILVTTSGTFPNVGSFTGNNFVDWVCHQTITCVHVTTGTTGHFDANIFTNFQCEAAGPTGQTGTNCLLWDGLTGTSTSTRNLMNINMYDYTTSINIAATNANNNYIQGEIDGGITDVTSGNNSILNTNTQLWSAKTITPTFGAIGSPLILPSNACIDFNNSANTQFCTDNSSQYYNAPASHYFESGGSGKLEITNTGLVGHYNNFTATAGQGVEWIPAATGAITIGSGSSIAATSLCSTTQCAAGEYQVHVYVDLTTACTTTGSYIVWIGYTDDAGAKTGSSTTTFIPINGLGVTQSTGSLALASTSNYGQGIAMVRTTGAATGGLGSINYGTTATACGTGGPMVGKMYLDVTRLE